MEIKLITVFKNIIGLFIRENNVLPIAISDGVRCKDFDLDTVIIVIHDIKHHDYKISAHTPPCDKLSIVYCDMV